MTRPAIYFWQSTNAFCRNEPTTACLPLRVGGINWIFRFRHVIRVHSEEEMGCWLCVGVFKRRESVHDSTVSLADRQSTAHHPSLPQCRPRSASWKRLLGSHQTAVDRGTHRGIHETEIHERSWWSLDKGWQIWHGVDDECIVYVCLGESCQSSLVNMLTSLGKGIGQSAPAVSFDASIRSSHHPYFVTYCGFLCVERQHPRRSATRPSPTDIRRQ